jgi:alcohol dehydrogenase (NADP+)
VGLFKKWIEIRGKYIAMSTPTKIPASSATERILSLTNHLKDSSNTANDIQKNKMSAPYKFQGWMGLDKDADKGKMIWQEYEPKTWTEDDVDIKITHCGICGSDLHTLRSGWVRIR